MKEAILHTSLKQFLKYGIRKMSVQKLAEPLGISTKTVYKYFKNKEDLLLEALIVYYDRQFVLLRKMVAAQNVVPLLYNIWFMGMERETKVKDIFFQDLHDYYPGVELKIEKIVSDTMLNEFVQIIAKGIEEGSLINNIEPEVVFTSISILFTAVVRKGQFKDFHLPPGQILHHTIGIVIRGICTNEGKIELDRHIETINTSGGIAVFENSLEMVA